MNKKRNFSSNSSLFLLLLSSLVSDQLCGASTTYSSLIQLDEWLTLKETHETCFSEGKKRTFWGGGTTVLGKGCPSSWWRGTPGATGMSRTATWSVFTRTRWVRVSWGSWYAPWESGAKADPFLPPGFLRTEYYTPENQVVDGIVKMLEWLPDRGYPFAITGPIAREINCAKLKVECRLRLLGLLNLQMTRVRGPPRRKRKLTSLSTPNEIEKYVNYFDTIKIIITTQRFSSIHKKPLVLANRYGKNLRWSNIFSQRKYLTSIS